MVNTDQLFCLTLKEHPNTITGNLKVWGEDEPINKVSSLLIQIETNHYSL